MAHSFLHPESLQHLFKHVVGKLFMHALRKAAGESLTGAEVKIHRASFLSGCLM